MKVESLSEFARTAIFHYADEFAPATPQPTDLHVQLDLVTNQLQGLSSALGQLKACLMGAIGQEEATNGHANGGTLVAEPPARGGDEADHDS